VLGVSLTDEVEVDGWDVEADCCEHGEALGWGFEGR
jgi:hypothetical protein